MKRRSGTWTVCSFAALAGCASGPVLNAEQVQLVDDAPALACINLGVVTAHARGAAGLPGAEARAVAEDALRAEAAAQGADRVIFQGLDARGADIRVRGLGYDCSVPPPPSIGGGI